MTDELVVEAGALPKATLRSGIFSVLLPRVEQLFRERGAVDALYVSGAELRGETYFRAPAEMLETLQWWKLMAAGALAHEVCRLAAAEIATRDKIIADLRKESRKLRSAGEFTPAALAPTSPT